MQNIYVSVELAEDKSEATKKKAKNKEFSKHKNG